MKIEENLGNGLKLVSNFKKCTIRKVCVPIFSSSVEKDRAFQHKAMIPDAYDDIRSHIK